MLGGDEPAVRSIHCQPRSDAGVGNCLASAMGNSTRPKPGGLSGQHRGAPEHQRGAHARTPQGWQDDGESALVAIAAANDQPPDEHPSSRLPISPPSTYLQRTKKGRKRLVLGGRTHLPHRGQMGQEGIDLRLAHLPGMSHPVKAPRFQFLPVPIHQPWGRSLIHTTNAMPLSVHPSAPARWVD